MPKSRLLLSASGVLTGAFLFAAPPAFAQMPVFDGVNYALQGVIKAIEQTMSDTLSNITKQLASTGPLGTILGDIQNGSITTLLVQGFTQNANYAKAQVDAISQITDGALTSHARFQRDMRNATIRDEHTTSSLHCVALDAGQTVTASAGSSWKVAQSISDVADNRGEAGPNQPAFYGQSQAVAAIAQLHFARYCSQAEATAGLCSLSATPNADQRASTLFGTGTLAGQTGVTAANDFATNLIEPIVPAGKTVLESRVQASFSPPNTTQPSREIGPDSAAAPVSPPASDRNAATSAHVKTSASPQPPTTPDPKPQSQTSSPKPQITPQDDQRPQGTASITAATMAVGALTGTFRRPETRSQPPAPAAPAEPRPSAPQSLLNRFAVKNILDTLRGPQDKTRAAPASASTLSPEKAGATASANAMRAPTTNAAASPGGLRDKLTTFTAERMQPRRDAEQVRGVTQAATGVIASLQAVEQQETTRILTRIRDAAKTNGGIENVLSEMRPGGQFEDLRKEFNTVRSFSP